MEAEKEGKGEFITPVTSTEDKQTLLELSNDGLAVVLTFLSNAEKWNIGFTCKRFLSVVQFHSMVWEKINVQKDLPFAKDTVFTDELVGKVFSCLNFKNVVEVVFSEFPFVNYFEKKLPQDVDFLIPSLNNFDYERGKAALVKHLEEVLHSGRQVTNFPSNALTIDVVKVILKKCPKLEILDVQACNFPLYDRDWRYYNFFHSIIAEYWLHFRGNGDPVGDMPYNDPFIGKTGEVRWSPNDGEFYVTKVLREWCVNKSDVGEDANVVKGLLKGTILADNPKQIPLRGYGSQFKKFSCLFSQFILGHCGARQVKGLLSLESEASEEEKELFEEVSLCLLPIFPRRTFQDNSERVEFFEKLSSIGSTFKENLLVSGSRKKMWELRLPRECCACSHFMQSIMSFDFSLSLEDKNNVALMWFIDESLWWHAKSNSKLATTPTRSIKLTGKARRWKSRSMETKFRSVICGRCRGYVHYRCDDHMTNCVVCETSICRCCSIVHRKKCPFHKECEFTVCKECSGDVKSLLCNICFDNYRCPVTEKNRSRSGYSFSFKDKGCTNCNTTVCSNCSTESIKNVLGKKNICKSSCWVDGDTKYCPQCFFECISTCDGNWSYFCPSCRSEKKCEFCSKVFCGKSNCISGCSDMQVALCEKCQKRSCSDCFTNCHKCNCTVCVGCSATRYCLCVDNRRLMELVLENVRKTFGKLAFPKMKEMAMRKLCEKCIIGECKKCGNVLCNKCCYNPQPESGENLFCRSCAFDE